MKFQCVCLFILYHSNYGGKIHKTQKQKQIDLISVAVVPSKQKLFVQPKLEFTKCYAKA